MGINYFAHGVYGIALSPLTDKLPEITAKLGRLLTDDEYDRDAYRRLLIEKEEYGEDLTPEDVLYFKAQTLLPELELAMRQALDIQLPEDVHLFYTGDGEDWPGRCDADPEEWIVGIGLHHEPYDHAPAEQSFSDHADWHTWVTAG